MKQLTTHPLNKILKLAGSIADKGGYGAFCVGGFVRDMLLGVDNFDIDIVIEGDGLRFARELARELKSSLVIHKRFGTATIVKEKIKVDIATARAEYYKHPAALPDVNFSSIRQDLYRRDFTINAMAMSLNKGTYGKLVDFFNGKKDLKSKKIRVLHDSSFIDDPTRIFRAVRFEQRYQFHIERHTEALINKAVKLDMFGRTQKQRLRNEIILILSEDRPSRALKRFYQLHELRFIHPKLKFSKRMLKLFLDIEKVCAWYRKSSFRKKELDEWIIYLFAILDDLNIAQTKDVCEKFVFKKIDEQNIISCKASTKKALKALQGHKEVLASDIYKVLQPFSYEIILFLMAKADSKKARKRIEMFLKKYKDTYPSITGKDLKAIGIKPGPKYSRILKAVLYAKLDGKISCKKDELSLAEMLAGNE